MTSHKIQTRDKSEIVNRLGELSRVLTPAARDVLFGDHPGHGGEDVHDPGSPGGARRIDPQEPKPLRRVLDVHCGLVRRILCDLQILLGDSAMTVEVLGPGQLPAREAVVRSCLAIVRHRVGYVRALDPEEELPSPDVVAELHGEVHDAAGCEGDDRDGLGHVGADDPGDRERRGDFTRHGRDERKPLGMIETNDAAV